MVAHGRKVMDAHGPRTHGRRHSPDSTDLRTAAVIDVRPIHELKDDADSEQHGRFNSVQFTSFSLREGFTN